MEHGIFLAGLRVLIVEDEMMVSLLIEDTLTDANCIIVGPCNDVASALAVARIELIDLAVLDVNLGGEKVYPVADVLVGRGIPFLLLSGYGSNAIPIDRPDWRVCSKPFKPRELIAQLLERVERSANGHA